MLKHYSKYLILAAVVIIGVLSCMEWKEYPYDGINWITVPGGTFNMGCVPQDNECDSNELPRHSVTVKSFQMTQSEITRAMYVSKMYVLNDDAYGESLSADCQICPATDIEWKKAKEFCETIGGRLPTEAEWEYAARAGSETIYSCGDDPSCLDDVAWYGWGKPGFDDVRAVTRKKANAFQLYDMFGGVGEWVADCYKSSYEDVQSENKISNDCSDYVVRGGSIQSHASNLRASYRFPRNDYGYFSDSFVGIRCARDIGAVDGDVDGDIDGDSDEDTDVDGDVEVDIEEEIVGDPTWTDTSTGLMWQMNPGASKVRKDDADTYCSDLVLDGYSDWVVPSIDNLRTLVDDCQNTETGGSCTITDICRFVDKCANYDCGGCGGSGCYLNENLTGDCSLYWSSTRTHSIYDTRNNYQWGIDFSTGAVMETGSWNDENLIRCVRQTQDTDGDSDTVDAPGFLCEGGVCWDLATGLEWQQQSTSGVVSLDYEADHCDNLTLDGGGWRMPSVSELRTLVRGCEAIEVHGECEARNSCDACGTGSGYSDYDTCLSCGSCKSDCDPDECVDGAGNNGCYWPEEFGTNCEIEDNMTTTASFFSSSRCSDYDNGIWLVNFKEARVSNGTIYGYAQILCVR